MKNKKDLELIAEAYKKVIGEEMHQDEPALKKFRSFSERPNYNPGAAPYDYLDLPAVVLTINNVGGEVHDSKIVKHVKQLGYPGTRSGNKPFRDIAKGIYIYGNVFDANETDDFESGDETVDVIITSESPKYRAALKAHETGNYSAGGALDEVYKNLGW